MFRSFAYRLIGIMVLVVLAGCQQGEPGTDTVAEAADAENKVSVERTGPAISVDPQRIHLGTMEQHETRSNVIVIKNIGTEQLNISNVKPTCGCTVAKLATSVLAPGESTPLTIEFSSKRYSGEVEKKIRILSNDPETPDYGVFVAAKVHVPVYVIPKKKIITNQAIAVGEIWSDTVEFSTDDVDELMMAAIEYNKEVLQVDIENGADGDAQKSVMTVSNQPDLLPGDYRELIKVMPNVPGAEYVPISVRAKILGDLRPERDFVSLGAVVEGEQVSDEIVVAAIDKEMSFTITGAEIDLEGFTTTVINGDENWKSSVIVEGTPVLADADEQRQNRARNAGMLTMYTDYPSQPKVWVRLMYVVRRR